MSSISGLNPCTGSSGIAIFIMQRGSKKGKRRILFLQMFMYMLNIMEKYIALGLDNKKLL